MNYFPAKQALSSVSSDLMVSLLKKNPKILEEYASKLLTKGERPDVCEIIRNPRNVGDTFKRIMMR